MANKKKEQNINTSDDAQGGRTSLYFAPSESDLLAFVNTQPVKRNKFIISLIRDAYERQKAGETELTQTQDKITNEDLLNEIKSLKTFIQNHSFKIDDSSSVEDKSLEQEQCDKIDDYDAMESGF